MAGSLVMVTLFIFVGTTVGDDPATLAGWIERFPDIRAYRIIENGVYLLVLVLWMLHFAALGHRLMSAPMATGLFAAVLGIVGLTIMAAGALPHVATGPIADLYVAGDGGEAERATLALIFRASWWVADMMLFAGLAILPFALALAALAMPRDAGFGAGWALAAAALAAFGIFAAIAVMIYPGSPIAALGMFAQLFFHLGFGWRLAKAARAAE